MTPATSFATCGYLGLDRDPRLAAAAVSAIERFGVTFGSSRAYATSPLLAEADILLERIFGRPVVLAGSTTLAHGAALPVLLHRKDLVLHDRLVHTSVQTALAALGPRGPRCEEVPHGDLDALERAIQIAVTIGARRVWYCADGVNGMYGDRLDGDGLATLMARYPALHAYVDDAYGMSWCGARGAGSLVDARLPADRTVIATSLGKGFGCSGGVVVVPDLITKHRIEEQAPPLMFSVQLAPPVLGAICASARIHLDPEITRLQAQLASRIALAHELVAADPELGPRRSSTRTAGAATPLQYLELGDVGTVITAAARLLDRGIHVNPIAYPAVPVDAGGLRIAVARTHTDDELRTLVREVAEVTATAAAEGLL